VVANRRLVGVGEPPAAPEQELTWNADGTVTRPPYSRFQNDFNGDSRRTTEPE
jgi:hypothetical protein